jgi:hypothetical protein
LSSVRRRYAEAIEEGLKPIPPVRALKDMTPEERARIAASLGAPLSLKARLT